MFLHTILEQHDPLHYTIYEKLSPPAELVVPLEFWAYRPKITLETFFNEMQHQVNEDNNPLYPILQHLHQHVWISFLILFL